MIIGVTASLFTAASMLPQLIKVWKEKRAEGLSLWMLVILLTGLGSWIFYGILKEDWIIIISNAFAFLLNIVLAILSYRYKKKEGTI